MAYGNTAKDGSGSFYHQLVNADGELIIDNGWDPELQSDVTLNDSDKTFTVPAGTKWKLKTVWVEYTSTATAGNRQLVLELQDDTTDVFLQIRARAVQAASLTRYYAFLPDSPGLAAFYDTNWLSVRISEFVLPAGYVVRIYDNKAFDAAADDVIIHMMIESRSVP